MLFFTYTNTNMHLYAWEHTIFFLPIILVFIGITGLLYFRKNIIFILLCIEIILLGISLLFFFFAIKNDCILGYIFIYTIFTIAAAETAIGLSLIISFYRQRYSVSLDHLLKIKT